MKVLVAHLAFRLPDNFEIKKGDNLNEALEALIIYRMTRDRTQKSKKVHIDGKKLKTGWLTSQELWVKFLTEVSTTDRKLIAYSSVMDMADPPKLAPKKTRTR